MYLEHIDEHIDEENIDNVPILYDQDRYDQWIEALAKHELDVIIDGQVNPELELRETVGDVFTWVEHSGTIQSFDYADNYYAIKARGHTDPDYLTDSSADDWRENPYREMEMVASSIVTHDVSSVLQGLIDEYEHEQIQGRVA